MFEYSPLGEELKTQTSAAEKQYQKLNKEFLNLIKRKKKIMSNVVYNKGFTFYKYHNINEFAKRSFYLKQNDLTEFKDNLETLSHYTKEMNK